MLSMRPLRSLIGIGVQADVGGLADVHGIEIVFVNVADDPDIRKIGDGEGIGAGQALHAGCVGDLLVGNDAGDGGDDVDDAGGMVFIDAEKLQLLGCGIQVGFGIAFGVFGLFEGALGDGAFIVENLGAFKLQTSQTLIVLGLQIGLVGAGDVVAANSEQQLAFLHRIAEPGLDLHNSSGGQRDHGTAREISGCTTPVTFRAGALCARSP